MESTNSISVDRLLGSHLENDPGIGVTEPACPIPLTYAKHRALTTLKLESIDDLPEYPTSHIHGYAYVVSARGRSQTEMEQVVQEIQYAKHLTNKQKRPVYCPFFKCKAKKWTWKCSGIYACEFLNPLLGSLHHTSVDESMLQEIQKAQGETQLLGENPGKRNAYNYYRSKVNLFKRGQSCIDQLPTCKPVFKRSSQVNPYGEYTPYIGCTNDSSIVVTKHHRGVIQGHKGIDLQFLEDLLNKEILPATEDCGVFEPLSSRRKHCDRDHPQGPGRLKHTTCDVVFNALVPVDISQCPYILFTSNGVHKHPPPPSTKPPRHMSREASRKRRRSSSSSVSESQSALPQPQSSRRSSRSASRSTSQNGDHESIRSSQYPRRGASRNALTSEQRREELERRKLEAYRKQREAELKQLEMEIEKQEEENRLMRLEIDKRWLKLMEEGIPFSRSRTSTH